MSEAEVLGLSVQNQIATLRLQRPAARNAVSPSLVGALRNALSALRNDETVRAIVLAGSPQGAFAAGIDLRALLTLTSPAIAVYFEDIATLLWELATYPKPTVAAVSGPALGAGADLAAACDVRIASANAIFAFPGLAFGLVLGTRRLVQLVGPARAAHLVYSGRRLPAPEAQSIGLVDVVGEDPEALAQTLAHDAAARPPHAIRLVKEIVSPTWDLEADLQSIRASLADPEFLERLRAFVTAQLKPNRQAPS